jgi:PhoH-like ATPase
LHQNLNFIKSSLNAESLKSKEPATNNDARPSANKKKYKKPKSNEVEIKDEKKNIVTLLEEQGKIQIQPMSYIRGGTFNNTIIIVDESQNMTPHEAKTIITRAGNNTIVIFCGDIEQIDSHYLSERSNGFSYTRYKMGDKEITAFVHLIKGERSYLASVAAENM